MPYDIKSGDTLTSIAKLHNTSIAELKALNTFIVDEDVIFAGDKLTLPGESQPSTEYETRRLPDLADIGRSTGLPPHMRTQERAPAPPAARIPAPAEPAPTYRQTGPVRTGPVRETQTMGRETLGRAQVRIDVMNRDGSISQNVDERMLDPIGRQALENTRKVTDYAQRTFGRDGIDGRGSDVGVVVHYRSRNASGQGAAQGEDNAYYDFASGKIQLGDGNTRFAPLGGSLDVVAHEFFHGVLNKEGIFADTPMRAAIHESVADVLGTGIDGDWNIGEDVMRRERSLRDIERPRIPHLSYLNGQTGLTPHDASGPISRAAVLSARTLGEDGMRQVWYRAATEHLRPDADFDQLRAATLLAAQELYGVGSVQVQAVEAAWTEVGMPPGRMQRRA